MLTMLLRHEAIYVVLFITAAVVATNNGNYGYAGLDTDLHLGNLGTVISQRVAKHVSGLTSQLNQRLAGLNSNLQEQMQQLNRQLQVNMHDISLNVQDNLHGLTETIQHRVAQSLEPVNALMIKSAMAQGIGGMTVAVYGDGIQHILLDGSPYKCAGELVQDPAAMAGAGVKCTTDLVFQPADPSDVCTDSSYSRVNNLYCFGHYASFVCIDRACQCRGGVMHTLDHLRNTCGTEYGTGRYVKYDYYPNLQNANHIAVPHANKYVTCENAGEHHCVWHGNGFVLATSEYTGANL